MRPNLRGLIGALGCAYRQLETYPDFIRRALHNDDVYRRNPRRFEDLLKFLTNYAEDQMPEFVPDADLLSFANGVLRLSTMEIEPYATMADEKKALVCRHHIAQEYTGTEETPLLDVVLNSQFDDVTAEVLCALFGRLLFDVGEFDNWQVMPYLVGHGSTGKSLMLTVASRSAPTAPMAAPRPILPPERHRQPVQQPRVCLRAGQPLQEGGRLLVSFHHS